MKSRKFRDALRKFGATSVLLFAAHCYLQAQADSPSGRHLSHAAYDEQRKGILLYGGSTGAYTYRDLWILDSSGWKKLFDGGPTERIKAAFAYDTHRNTAVLFGGSGANNKLLDDTWEWDGTTWKQNAMAGPPSRNHALAAYDKKNKAVVMFGGVGPTGLLSDTWTFDGSTWRQVDTNGPKDCLPHGMFYNDATQKTVLITLSVIRDPKDEAHAINTMWEWTGTSWKTIPEGSTFVTSSNLQAISIHGSDGLVLFDGSDVTNNKCKTWIFSKSHWESRNLDGPSNRFGHVMVFDKSRGKTILFGGFGNGQLLNDLWSWDGQAWTEVRGVSKK